MIADVNHALRGLLTPLLPAGCDVRFGAPGGRYAEPGEAALVFFLAEIREDEKGGDTDWEDIRDADGRVVARRPPVRRFDLYYLVTTETADPDVEAALLDAVLTVVDPGKRLAADLLPESLAGRPVTLRLGDGWGGGLPDPPARTILSVIANAPLVPPVVTDVAAPAESIRLGVSPPGRATPPSQSGPSQSGPSQSGPSQSGPSQSGPSQSGPSQSGPVPAAGPRRWRGATIVEDDDPVRSQDDG